MTTAGGTWRMVTAMALSGTIGACVAFSGQAPLNVVFFRCLIGAIALLGLLWWRGGWTRLDTRACIWISVGAAALIGNWLCLFSAFSLCGISVATVVYHVQPFILILLAALAARQAPDWRQLPFLLFAFVGVGLTTGMRGTAMADNVLMGVLLALAAAFLYALATLATRELKAYPPSQIAGLQLVLGVVVLAPMVDVPWAGLQVQAWGSLLTIGLIHTGLVYNLMYGAFQRLRPQTIANLSFIYPAVAVATDVMLFGTTLTAPQWFGMALILASVVANQRIGHKRAGKGNATLVKTRPDPSGCHGNSPGTDAAVPRSCG